MKKIGFIDYFIDEWHANNYPKWIYESAKSKGINVDVSYAWAEINNPDGISTEDWCKKYDIKKVETIDEIVSKADYLIILSPDNPEKHEELSELALMSGKPVYIDKTFSPDLETGIRMFDLAHRYNTPIFSSSALRFANGLSIISNSENSGKDVEYISTLGPGAYSNYSVHQFEIIVSIMGIGARRVKSLSTKNGRVIVIEYKDGRRASMTQIQGAPFQTAIQFSDGSGTFINSFANMFPGLIDAMLDFFSTGKSPVAKEETLEIMAIIEAGHKAMVNYDTWINL